MVCGKVREVAARGKKKKLRKQESDSINEAGARVDLQVSLGQEPGFSHMRGKR